MTFHLLTVRRWQLALAAWMLSGVGSMPEASADVFDVYIAAGQSNMDGRGFRSDLTGPLSAYASPQSGTLLRYTNPGNSDGSNAYQTNWVNLAPGYSVQPNYTGSLPSTRFGPDVSFGKEMTASTSERRVAIIKVTRGSTSLEVDWDPSDGVHGDKGHMYEGFEIAVPAAIAALQNEGHSVEIRGMIWHQGEADSSSATGRAQYEENLTEFIEAVRKDLGYENLPFLIGDLERHPDGNDSQRTAIRNAQIAVADAMEFVEFVDSIGLAVQDQHHFNTAGVVELGRRFAATMNTTILNLPGDFNRDGFVDQEDFEIWSFYEGSITDARADGNSDGVVDVLDLRIWQTAVPEPSSVVLTCTAAMFAVGYVYWRGSKQRGGRLGAEATVDEIGVRRRWCPFRDPHLLSFPLRRQAAVFPC